MDEKYLVYCNFTEIGDFGSDISAATNFAKNESYKYDDTFLVYRNNIPTHVATSGGLYRLGKAL